MKFPSRDMVSGACLYRHVDTLCSEEALSTVRRCGVENLEEASLEGLRPRCEGLLQLIPTAKTPVLTVQYLHLSPHLPRSLLATGTPSIFSPFTVTKYASCSAYTRQG